MQPARGGKRANTTRLNAKYWQRLKKQFETCTYTHSGAYRQYSNGTNEEIDKMAAEINATEELLQSEKYRQLHANGYFKARVSDRLHKAGSFFKDKVNW